MNINLTLVAQLISFVVFVWFTMKFVWTPIMAALEERKNGIADGLAAGDRGQHEQELAKNRAREVLHEAKMQASEIVSQAQKRAGEVCDEATDNAQAEGARILTAAKVDVEQEAVGARGLLRERVAELAVAGAAKILQREVDAEAHRDIVASLAKQI
ncbi:MAG: F0F1 ATP synthase subunit B [Alphaproteobacteria bacterium]|nr:F0F1 ATP synthase subunit B [Alphaproteobacteria bacterium]